MPTLLATNNYHYLRGGAETVFFNHSQILEALGWQVIPFAMRHPKNVASEWSRFFVDETEFGHDYSLAEKMLRAPRVVYSVQARRRLGQLLKQVRPDVCHAHNIYHHISPSILPLLHGAGIPVVLTTHDLKIACPNYKMLTHDGVCERCLGGRVYNAFLHRCIKDSVALSALVTLEAVLHRLLGSYRNHVDRFVVPSRFYLQKLVEWGVPAEKCRYVPNFVEINRYQPQYTAGDEFLYFGRLSPEKGLETLIRAAADAGCALAIAGVGPSLETLRSLALALGGETRFLGFLGGDALHTAIRSARAVVIPSEWYENAPISVLEAYALGKPVIGARIGGIPELIIESETGFQFRSGDTADLASVLRRVASTSVSDLAAMGRCGRELVARAFTAQQYRDQILGVYGEIGVRT